MYFFQHWSEIATNEVIQSSSSQEKVEDQLNGMLMSMFSTTMKGNIVFYIRELGRSNREVYELLFQIEQTRMNYAKQLFVAIGLSPERAELQASLLYHYYLGWYERYKYEQVNKSELERHIQMIRSELLGL